MTPFDIEEGARDYVDVETISPLAVWEAMAVPTTITIPWRSLWATTGAFFSGIFSRAK